MNPDYAQLMYAVDNFRNKRILCIGDLMLDRYVYGDVTRISPEAPIPVLSTTREETMLGAAGNVARNIAALGAKVDFYSSVGNDRAGFQLMELLGKEDNITCYVSTTGETTTTKTRYISGSQQILRVDIDADYASDGIIPDAMKHCDAVIISDYAKNFIGSDNSTAVIAWAKTEMIPIVVDSKSTHIEQFKDATVYTPNLGEMSRVLGCNESSLTDDKIEAGAKQIIADYGMEHVLVTRASKGMTLQSANGNVHIPAQAREVYDVVGAGDTVAAVLALGLSVGLSVADASFIANIAGGIVVGKRGTAVVSPHEIKANLLELMDKALKDVKICANIPQTNGDTDGNLNREVA